eukprot:TRINITY_DN24592_c0_g2_i2.p1 TRINITY_DN24592_c0_g2~~TRINITY_DN24592_c0_g2_i2.p1  ORF type:complete len:297 (-),score=55.72 TRINITY_DN24592_c0_g2_i2:20-886(-)
MAPQRLSAQMMILEAAAQRDVQALLGVVRTRASELNAVSVSTAAHRLARLLKAERRQHGPASRRSVHELRAPLLSLADKLGPQGIANTLWALATLHCEDDELFSRLSEVAAEQTQQCSALHLSNLAWALATLSKSESTLVAPLANEVPLRAAAGEFTPQGLSNILWSFVELRNWDARVFDSVGAASAVAASKFNAQDFSNTLWAFSMYPRHSSEHKPMLRSFAVAAASIAPRLKPQDLSNIVWAFADVQSLCLDNLRRRKRAHAKVSAHAFVTSAAGERAWRNGTFVE